jgi:two-component system LytT family response regulator
MTSTINCVVIDDDQFAIDIISDYIAEIPRLHLQKSFTSSVRALSELATGIRPEILFMDIDMPDISGLQLAGQLEDRADHIIFTTSHPEHAIASFDVGAKHYLLKPFELGRFTEVVMKVTSKTGFPSTEPKVYTPYYFLKPGPRGEFIRLLKNQVLYIQAAGNYIHVYEGLNKHSTNLTVKQRELDFPKSQGFHRVHRSYIVNLAFVTRIVGNIVYLGKHPVPMGGGYKAAFLAYLNQHTLLTDRISLE